MMSQKFKASSGWLDVGILALEHSVAPSPNKQKKENEMFVEGFYKTLSLSEREMIKLC